MTNYTAAHVFLTQHCSDRMLSMMLKINEKALREMQTLRTGCSKAEPTIFDLPQTPFPVAQDG